MIIKMQDGFYSFKYKYNKNAGGEGATQKDMYCQCRSQVLSIFFIFLFYTSLSFFHLI
jgi:hypothetical protein